MLLRLLRICVRWDELEHHLLTSRCTLDRWILRSADSITGLTLCHTNPASKVVRRACISGLLRCYLPHHGFGESFHAGQ
jgi:hypothetical protein